MATTVASNLTTQAVFMFGGKARTEFIYQDDKCVVFEEDLEDKAAPSHFLVVPRQTITRLADATEQDEQILGHLLLTAKSLAMSRGLRGYHVTVDESHVTGQLLCLHVFGRALHHMLWPVEPGSRL